MTDPEHLSTAPRPADVFGQFEHTINETDPAIVDAQIAYGLAVEERGGVFFNNFVHNMPGGKHRAMVTGWGMLDRTLASPEDVLDPSKPLSHSELARTKTYAQFFSDIDRAIAASGLDLAVMEQLNAAMNSATTLEDEYSAALAYTRYTMRVYRDLRLEGYSHGDLYS